MPSRNPSRIASVVLACLCGVPFLHSHAFNDPVYYPQLLGMALLGLAWAVLWWRMGPGFKAIEWRILLPPAGLLLWSALSVAWALHAGEALMATARWGLVLAYALLLQQAVASGALGPTRLSRGITVLLGAMAVVGLLQAAGIDPMALSDAYHSPNAFFANRNFFGTAMALGIPFGLHLLLADRLPWRIWGATAMALCMAGVIVSLTRAALLPLLLGAALLPPVLIWRRTVGRTRWLLLAVWLGLAGTAMWSSKFVLKNKEARIHWEYLGEAGHHVDLGTSSMDFRLITWQRTLALAQERPLLGHGAGNWKLQVQRLGLQSYNDKDEFGMVVPLHPHNEWLSALSELGVPGLLLLMAAWGVGVWGAGRMAFGRERSEGDFGLMLLWAWVAMAFDAAFAFPLERPFHLLAFCLLLAASSAGLRPAARGERWARLAVPVAMAVLGGLAVLVVARMRADIGIREVREAHAAQRPEQVLRAVPGARNWATDLDPVAALSVDWYAAMAHAQLGRPADALAAMRTAESVTPNSLAVRSGLASLLDLNGQSQAAADSMSRLLEVYPNDDEGWLNLGIMQVHAGRPALAREALRHVRRDRLPERYDQVDAALRGMGQ